MWRHIKENKDNVTKSMDEFGEMKPRTRIQLSEELLSEFEKIRRGKSQD